MGGKTSWQDSSRTIKFWDDMSEDEKNNWEKKYSGDGYEPNRKPSALLTEWLEARPPGRALDLACGTGRNALYLAEKGFEVTAIDVSPRAIALGEVLAREKGLKINWIVADLDEYALPGQFDLIVISFFYVNRNLVTPIIKALKKGGILLYESHLLAPSAAAEEASRHRFHFRPGELGQLFPGLTMIRYEERRVDKGGDRPSYLASLVAQKE
jgi:tellurite methyltransferase